MIKAGCYPIVSLLFFIFAIPVAVQAENKAVVGVAEIGTSLPNTDVITFRTMVETAIISSNRFSVIERGRMEAILEERAMGEYGLTDAGGTIVGVSGVDYLIYGTITQLGAKQESFGFGGFATGKKTVSMAVDLRITDVDTGEIRYAGTVQKSINAGTATQFGGISTGRQSDASSDLGEIQRTVAKSIANVLVTNIYPIKVVTVNNGLVFLNYGSSILSKGDYLNISSLGEEIIDPDTGIVLGSTEKEIGIIKVTEATNKFSKAEMVSGEVSNIAAGHIARPTSAPARDKKRKKKKKKL